MINLIHVAIKFLHTDLEEQRNLIKELDAIREALGPDVEVTLTGMEMT